MHLPDAVSEGVMAIAEAHAIDRILLEFRMFGAEVLGEDTSAMDLEELKTRIAVAAGRPHVKALHLYERAAAEFGIAGDIARDRDHRSTSARWAVWLALSKDGWSAAGIGARSHPHTKWNHGTILNALSTIERWSGVAGSGPKVRRAKRIVEVARKLRAS